jgi:tetratricopeptide (TPR) repeat protein
MNKILNSRYSGYILLSVSLIWTFLLYVRVTGFDFVNLDDNYYVYQNNDITKLTIQTLITFFKSFYLGMYQPLTMLCFAVEYHFFGLNPAVFHSVNLLFHLINVLLVFILINKITGKIYAAFTISLFFGIHPMHVESVAWISERKDVLYSFFYLIGLIWYVKFLQKRIFRFWLMSLVFFLLSLLSKSAAVTFPLIILLLDFYFQKQNFSLKKSLKSIWPFFILSIVFGIISFISQETFNSTDITELNYNLFNKLSIAGFSYFIYVFYTIVPSTFSALHPLPVETGLFLPVIYYVYTAISCLLIFTGCYLYKNRGQNELYNNLLFGLCFYSFTIFLILNNPSSKAIYADRYSYLPYIGLFFILSVFFQYIADYLDSKKIRFKYTSLVFVLVLAVFYTIRASSFISNWKNSDLLWNKTISNEPSAFAYFCRAVIEKDQNKTSAAINDYQKSVRINEKFYQAYVNLAAIYIEQTNYSKALILLNKAILINPSFPEAFYNRGLIYNKLNKFNESIVEFTSAIKINPGYALAYFSRANAYASLKKFEQAFHDVDQCVANNPADYASLALRGYIFYKYNQFENGLRDLNTSIKLKPDYLLAYNNRALIYRALHKYNDALRDLNFVIRNDPGFINAVFNRAKIYIDLGQYEMACKDLKTSGNKGISEAARLMEEYCR